MRFIFLLFLLFPFSLFSQSLQWMDFNEGIKKALKEKKMVLLDFYTNWCGFCKKMHKEVYSDKKVQEILNKYFVTIKIDGDNEKYLFQYNNKQYKAVDFFYLFEIEGFPTTAFIDEKGEIITSLPGYIPVHIFQSLLVYVYSKCYEKNVDLEKFIQTNKCGT